MAHQDAGTLPTHEVVKARLLAHLENLVGDRDPYLAAGSHYLAQIDLIGN
jgi:hypothetical protein